MENDKMNVIFGCLLHDIGKVLYRYGDGRNHAISGAAYLQETVKMQDKDILEQVKYHHGKMLKDSGVSQDSLAYICYVADNIAAATDRRPKDEAGNGFVKNLPLESIFNLLNENNGNMHYQSSFLDTEEISYPTERTLIYDESFYAKCLQNITDACKGIQRTDSYINSLLEILEGNLSFVPSSTSQKEVADISLYDHCKMTAAFGSSIFAYLQRNRITNYKKEIWENAAEFYKKKIFLLYSMDISGIQDFIYTISSEGALKNLRARSSYLEILMEHMIDELLALTGYSRTNLIYCGGGHAYLLLDHTEETIKHIRQFEHDMNRFFMETFSISLYLAGGMAPCSANDLKNEPDGSYSEIFREVANQISKKKSQRYDKEDILFFQQGNQADMERECRVCKRVDLLNEENICQICSAIQDFSNKIQKEAFFVVLDQWEAENLLPLPNGKYLAAESKDKLQKRILEGKNYVRAYCKNEMYTGLDVSTKLWVGDYKKANTFEELAEAASGIKRLGVLRADVDNLGQAFVKGFESTKHGNQYVTISRTATFSRKLGIFFKRYVNTLLKNGVYHLHTAEKDAERNIAIVYSGGDDVFVVGAWNDVVGFAMDLHESLEKFSQGTLSISAGIGIYPPKYPIAAMAREVGELEECAKSYPGKNAISLFDESNTYSWNDFIQDVWKEKYQELAEFFDAQDQERGKGFLYHLLEYIRNSDEKINIARFAYTLARMEPDKNADTETKERYRMFSKKMYCWIQNEKDRKSLITAIYLYVYSVRERQEE